MVFFFNELWCHQLNSDEQFLSQDSWGFSGEDDSALLYVNLVLSSRGFESHYVMSVTHADLDATCPIFQ